MIFGEYRLCDRLTSLAGLSNLEAVLEEHQAVYVFEPLGEDLARLMRQEIQDLQGEGLTLGKNLGLIRE